MELKRSFLKRYPDLKPVLIRGGQFRPGVPCRGVIVSPRQMLWIEPSGEHRGRFGSAQMLAKDPLAFRDREISVTYIAIACARPSFIRAEGLWATC